MILTVAFNAAVDKTYVVPEFRLDGRFYANSVVSAPGGKAINVARVLTELGESTKVMGFSAGHNGLFIEEGLAQEKIGANMVRIPGESRLCLTFVDSAGDNHTEVNENGPAVPFESVVEFLSKLRREIRNYQLVVLSGSLPPGLPSDIYAQCLRIASDAGVPGVLDAKAGALNEGLAGRPLLVKPNRDEFCGLLGRSVDGVNDVAQSIQILHDKGAKLALVSLGADGVVASDGTQIVHASLQKGRIVSAVGSGDALVAAFFWGYLAQKSFRECVQLAVAAGLANAWYLGAGFCKKRDIMGLVHEVQLVDL